MSLLVVSCHPLGDSFTAHVRDAALATLSIAHEVEYRDLYAGTSDDDPVLDLQWASGLVLIYPTWWSSMPAPLVQWVDDCLSAGDGFGRLERITVVTTHGSSRLVNLLEGEVGRRVLLRGLAGRAARRCRRQWVAMYNIDRSTLAQRQRFVARVRRTLAALG